jgi:transposase InsO family protein
VRDYFQDEFRLLGIASSPSFGREPEGHGFAERFFRTLKEQLLWVWLFDTFEELCLAFLQFKDRSNRVWLTERHGHQTPATVRAALGVDCSGGSGGVNTVNPLSGKLERGT